MNTADTEIEHNLKPGLQPWAVVVKRDLRLFIVAFCCLLGLGGILASLYFLTQNHLNSSVIQAAARYTEAIAEFRTIYTSEVVARLLPEGIEVTHDYQSRQGAIPLPATLSMALGRRLGATEKGVKWRLYSDFPFPWRTDGGPQDQFEIAALQSFRNNNLDPFFRFEPGDDHQVLRYATADIMRPACVGCHNNHKDSPKRDWIAGDVRGVLAVSIPVVTTISGGLTGVKYAFVFSGLILLLGGTLLSMVIARQRRNASMVAQHAVNLENEIRIREDAEEQLRQSNIDLLQFAHIASHDLSEPARKVMAFGDLLEEECSDTLGDDAKHYLERMIDASKRMRSLIDGLLNYSRVSRNAIPYSDLDLNQIANDAKSDLSHILDHLSGTIEIALLPHISANETQIRQLFQNLMANGLKFHRDGIPPIVKVDASIEEKSHSSATTNQTATCRITFSDNGIGFDPKYSTSIFEVFERLHGKEEYEGTGIGLSVCKKVVDRHCGTISAESRPGNGATFIVLLPVDRRQENITRERENQQRHVP